MPNQQEQIPDLLIKSNEVLQLNQLLEQVPTKWGYGLVNFFRAVGQARQQEAAIANQVTDNVKSYIPTGAKVSEPAIAQEDSKDTTQD